MNYDEPAFPVSFSNEGMRIKEDPFGREIYPAENIQYCGITKRDYFAAKAMQALIAKSPLFSTPEGNYSANSIAARAYAQADIMMEESNNEN